MTVHASRVAASSTEGDRAGFQGVDGLERQRPTEQESIPVTPAETRPRTALP